MKNNLGVALTNCFYCGKSNEIVINRRLRPGDASKVESMNGKVVSMDPCPECQELMQQGIILITIDPDKSEKGWQTQKIPNPYRTGGFFVVTEEGYRKVFSGPGVEFGLAHRWMFISHEAAEAVGLFQVAQEEANENGTN